MDIECSVCRKIKSVKHATLTCYDCKVLVQEWLSTSTELTFMDWFNKMNKK